jgi:hypothetical protein
MWRMLFRLSARLPKVNGFQHGQLVHWSIREFGWSPSRTDEGSFSFLPLVIGKGGRSS